MNMCHTTTSFVFSSSIHDPWQAARLFLLTNPVPHLSPSYSVCCLLIERLIVAISLSLKASSLLAWRSPAAESATPMLNPQAKPHNLNVDVEVASRVLFLVSYSAEAYCLPSDRRSLKPSIPASVRRGTAFRPIDNRIGKENVEFGREAEDSCRATGRWSVDVG